MAHSHTQQAVGVPALAFHNSTVPNTCNMVLCHGLVTWAS